jgi:putative membrane protein
MNATRQFSGTLWADYRRLPGILLTIYAVAWVIAAIRPSERQTWLLENLLVFVVLPVFIFTYKKFQFSNLSYVLIAVFLALHAVGAHYTYSEMPLGSWARDDWQLTRNHYDRIVHLAFGLLITFPLSELGVRGFGLSMGWSCMAAIHVLIAWSGIYELLEALVAHVTSPALGAAYNGAQGDEWDSQKDMALALLGSIMCMAMIGVWWRRATRRTRASFAHTPSVMPINGAGLANRGQHELTGTR